MDSLNSKPRNLPFLHRLFDLSDEATRHAVLGPEFDNEFEEKPIKKPHQSDFDEE